MSESFVDVVVSALDTIMREPRGFDATMKYVADGRPLPSQTDVRKCFPDQQLRVVEKFRSVLAALDVASGAQNAWTAGSSPNSRERRDRVYAVLHLEAPLRTSLESACPFLPLRSETVVIAAEHREWYLQERRNEHSFYWTQYRRYLVNKGFEPSAVQQLDDDTNEIVGRLSDPLSIEPYPSRGLVIGYVQSGKTTNFTGVIAKSIDSGYRLIIILAGTLNLLRNQTQRRLDMDLVGKENILAEFGERAAHDYENDAYWERFVEYGHLPSSAGGSNIARLTNYNGDFKALGPAIAALRVERRNREKPVYDSENLFHCDTRIIVCKKNGTVLAKLIRDLTRIKANLNEVPVLIIDDESDQASINTIRPRPLQKDEERKRNAINKRIVDILKVLPRAQYVGYTATPVANVFINPDDPQDLFPQDFLISLKAPEDYFGADRFHDLEEPASLSVEDSNDTAFVRDVTSEVGEDDAELAKALDLYILSGAIKLFRADRKAPGLDSQHHTMLVHLSHLQSEHSVLKSRIERLWADSGYYTGAAFARLQALLENDIRRVSEARAPELVLPATFAELKPFIQRALVKIDGDNNPVKMVNGGEDGDAPEFDKYEVWKIIVGGTKLSRGYTIEGLTVSYFRRTAGAQDTLLQMGRWFGYRPGYHDLVRLFVGRNEILKKATAGREAVRIDLLAAFKGTCRAESAFREGLRIYSNPLPGEARITPRDIAPLVELYFPDIPPVARARMWNAEVISENYGRRWIQPTFFSATDDVNRENLCLLEELARSSGGGFSQYSFDVPGGNPFGAVGGLVDDVDFRRFVTGFRFSTDSSKCFGSQRGFLNGEHGDHGIRDWLLVFPLLANSGRRVAVDGIGPELDVVERSRTGEKSRINALAGRNHREAVVPISSDPRAFGLSGSSAKYASVSRGVALIYLVVARGEQDLSAQVTPAFELFPSGNHLARRPKLRVRREGAGDVIDGNT